MSQMCQPAGHWGQRSLGISFLPKWWRQCTEKNAFHTDCYKLRTSEAKCGWVDFLQLISLSLIHHIDDLSSAHALLCPLSGGAPPFPFLKAVMAIGTGIIIIMHTFKTTNKANVQTFKIFPHCFTLQIRDLMCVSVAVAIATMSLHIMPAFSLTRWEPCTNTFLVTSPWKAPELWLRLHKHSEWLSSSSNQRHSCRCL